MTSKPASRSERTMTLAPRSWPSRPGLAMRMRRAGRSDMLPDSFLGLQDLDEHVDDGGIEARAAAVLELGDSARVQLGARHAAVDAQLLERLDGGEDARAPRD